MSTPTYRELAKMIDHSLLQPVLTDEELEAGCLLAVQYDVASVCIKPYYLKRCAELLAGSTVLPSTTIGFPHGGHSTSIKVAETKQALADGGVELDMVVNIGKVLSGDWNDVHEDIRAVTECTHQGGGIVKVIFENCFLNHDQKVRLCEICTELGCDFVKTSTGYGTGGSTVEDLKLMRRHSGEKVQVKAAGGVRTLDGLLEVRSVGATRCGASKTADMLDEAKRRYGV